MTKRDAIPPIAVSHRLTDERSAREDGSSRPGRRPRSIVQGIDIKAELERADQLAAIRSRKFSLPVSDATLLETSLRAHPTGRDGRSAMAADVYRKQALSSPAAFPPTHTYFSLTV